MRFLTGFICIVLIGAGLNKTVSAQGLAPDTSLFNPATAWEVTPSSLATMRGLAALNLPCMMKVGYENGFVLRLSGGGQKIMSMAIDFRQSAFVQGREYNTTVQFGDRVIYKIPARAFSPSVLIFNMKTAQNFYNVLKQGRRMLVEIDRNKFAFNLKGTARGLQRLEQCFVGKANRPPREPSKPQVAQNRISDTQRLAQAGRPAAQPTTVSPLSKPLEGDALPSMGKSTRGTVISRAQPLEDTGPRRSGFQEPGQVSRSLLTAQPQPTVRQSAIETPTEPVRREPLVVPQTPRLPPPSLETKLVQKPRSLMQGRVSREVTDSAPPRPLPTVENNIQAASAGEVWQAKAGADLRSTLEQWAGRAGVDLQWDATLSNAPVAQDLRVTGSFEEAVQTLMAQNATAYGLEADLRHEASIASASSVPQRSVRLPTAPAATWQGSLGGSQWVAVEGADLRQVLAGWAKKEGAAFTWRNPNNFAVKKNVQSDGSFIDALQELLVQYERDSVYPSVQFNTDPQTNQKTMVVE